MFKNFWAIYISVGDKCQSMMIIAIFVIGLIQCSSGCAPAAIFKPIPPASEESKFKRQMTGKM